MKIRLIFLALLCALLPFSSQAFLNDSDPQDFFSLVEKAPILVVATLQKTQNPSDTENYFLHSLQVEKSLKGPVSSQQIRILQEAIFPGEAGTYPKQGSFLAFLAPLPNYTAYAKAKSQGVEFRSFGGNDGVLLLKPETREIVLKTIQDYLKLQVSTKEASTQKRNFLFQTLSSPDLRLKSDAALALVNLKDNRGALSAQQAQVILSAMEVVNEQAQIALIQILQNSANEVAVATLKKLSESPRAVIQWPAVRALENLGHPRPAAQLVQDFPKALEKDRRGIVQLLARRNDPTSQKFLEKLLQADTPVDLKKEIILRMAETGGKAHEAILLRQLENPQEEVVAQSLVVLAGMQSSAVVDKIVSFLDSTSPLLKRAAQIALEKSKDPRAVKIYHERFGEKVEMHDH